MSVSILHFAEKRIFSGLHNLHMHSLFSFLLPSVFHFVLDKIEILKSSDNKKRASLLISIIL